MLFNDQLTTVNNIVVVAVKTAEDQWAELLSKTQVVDINKFERLARAQTWYNRDGDSYVGYVDDYPLKHTIYGIKDCFQPWRGIHNRVHGYDNFPAGWEVFTINARSYDLSGVVARNNGDGTVTVYRQRV